MGFYKECRRLGIEERLAAKKARRRKNVPIIKVCGNFTA
jgi:hypothetical protein